MKKLFSIVALLAILTLSTPAMAGTHGKDGKISGKSVGAAVCSLLVWPGIGQLINENPKDKNITHAVLGLTGIFRFWSCYDALVDRTGGVWHNRI
jgi:TM2 domain-containing membrane protein YozV